MPEHHYRRIQRANRERAAADTLEEAVRAFLANLTTDNEAAVRTALDSYREVRHS